MGEQSGTADQGSRQDIIDTINRMSRMEMARIWQYAKVGHPYFDMNLPYYDVFRVRFFDELGGFSSEISKHLATLTPKDYADICNDADRDHE